MSSYWLFKSEPGEFSIDELASLPDKATRWDGIRNFQARNFLRDGVRRDDLVFFYHSSCKTPGIAGIVRVISAPYPDPSQFNPDSPYFDPKSTADNPRWFSVDICLVRRFESVITAKSLKKLPELNNMRLFTQGRLSIQPVSSQHWHRIMAFNPGDF
jgi:predicted RNA-binding protein with PUA-like domain